VKAYQAQYPDPIVLDAGDTVALGKTDPEFPGWIWATSVGNGKSGWVPESFLARAGDEARSLREYSARELDVREGDLVSVLEELSGWARVESESGLTGWVPLSHLARSVTPLDLPI
jgi:uncharacterized protein YgiM (DUF1202 family)